MLLSMMVLFRRLINYKLMLILSTLLIAYIVIFILNSRVDLDYQRDEVYHRLRCSHMQTKISNMKSMKKTDMQIFTTNLTDLSTCSIKPNITLRELFRLQLICCCNASGSLFLTQKNSEVNEIILYETNRNIKYQLIPALYSKLPQDLPWKGRSLGRCAIVGSGGILNNSSCGAEIDSADYIIRFNLAPVNTSDVGMKCDLMNINPSQLVEFPNFIQNSDSLKKKLNEYTNTSFMIAAFAYTVCTKPSINLLQVMWPEHPLLFYNPSYLHALRQFWLGRGLQEARLSTGFMLISSALELCEDVHLYGFWPFSTDLQQRPVNYHYYDKMQPNRAVHAMPEEFRHLLQLHSQGVLTLHLQSCV